MNIKILLLAFLFFSCSPKNNVRIATSEWSFNLSTTSARAGPITFEVNNIGKLIHEVVIIKTDLPMDGLPMDGKYTVDERATGKIIGEIGDTKPGKKNSETFTLTSGHYLLVCNEASHYKAGMVAVFEVYD